MRTSQLRDADTARRSGTKKGNVAVAGHKASAAENGHRQPQRQPLAACDLSIDAALDLPEQLCDQFLAFHRVQELDRSFAAKRG